MSPRLVDREQKKLQIIGSAFTVFQEKGFESTKMADIAKVAGIGKGTIYEYFNSKEQLASETVETLIRLSQTGIVQQLDRAGGPEEQLRVFLRTLVDFFGQIGGVFRLILEVGRRRGESGEGEAGGYLVEAYRGMTRRVERMIDDGIEQGVFREVDTASLALLLVCIMDGLQLPYALDESLVDVEGVNRLIEGMVFNYLRV